MYEQFSRVRQSAYGCLCQNVTVKSFRVGRFQEALTRSFPGFPSLDAIAAVVYVLSKENGRAQVTSI